MTGELTSWSFPTRIVFGTGAALQLAVELDVLRANRVLLVSDPGIVASGLLNPMRTALEEAGVGFSIFDGVTGNPLEADIEAGQVAYAAFKAQAVVAVGGGSAMDAAKVIALRVNHRRPLADYDDAIGGDGLVTGEVPPIVAIPTTAGTGSEVGRSGVVTLEATGRKTVIFSPKLLPRVALLDPQLSRSLPPHLTAATGYDALTHCIEAYLSQGDHPMCDAIALEGMVLASGALRRAVHAPKDLVARGSMLKAAMMGAVAFQKGLGACHSLAHPLSSVCGLHHGLANALCLPAVVRFNGQLPRCAERYARVARILGASGAGVEACADALTALREDIGIVGGLAGAGVKQEQLAHLADEAFVDSCHALNPRACTRDELLALYQASF